MANELSYETLERISYELDGTDQDLGPILDQMGIVASAFDVETQLLETFQFGCCQECSCWSDGIWEGRCDLCRELD